MTSQTPMKKIWQMIRRISGKADPAAISHLKVNNSIIEQPGEIADILATTIAHNSSSDHYTDCFQRLKSREEKKQIRFSSYYLESYNQPFSMDELRAAIHKARDSGTGPDHIHYQMLKNLPESALDTLLQVSIIPGLLVTSPQLGQKLSLYQSLNWERILLTVGTTDQLH